MDLDELLGKLQEIRQLHGTHKLPVVVKSFNGAEGYLEVVGVGVVDGEAVVKLLA